MSFSADWGSELEAFTLVVESGSFSAAARRLNLAPSSVSRVIDRIEARLGVRLLLRTTRTLTVTPVIDCNLDPDADPNADDHPTSYHMDLHARAIVPPSAVATLRVVGLRRAQRHALRIWSPPAMAQAISDVPFFDAPAVRRNDGDGPELLDHTDLKILAFDFRSP